MQSEMRKREREDKVAARVRVFSYSGSYFASDPFFKKRFCLFVLRFRFRGEEREREREREGKNILERERDSTSESGSFWKIFL